MATMNVSLPDEMKKWVEEQTKDGTYANASDVVRDALRRVQRRQAAIERINRLIQEGIDSGPAVPFDFDEFKKEMHAEYAKRQRG